MKMEAKDLIMQSEVNRRRLMEIIYKAGAGHTGGDLSVMNLMTALYFDIMNVNPEDPKMTERDRFVLSKGHCVEALYTVFEARGFIKPGVLDTLTFRHSTASSRPLQPPSIRNRRHMESRGQCHRPDRCERCLFCQIPARAGF